MATTHVSFARKPHSTPALVIDQTEQKKRTEYYLQSTTLFRSVKVGRMACITYKFVATLVIKTRELNEIPSSPNTINHNTRIYNDIRRNHISR
jgi:hypothetical protein